MDKKVFNNVWAIRLISLLSAIMLVAFVQTENYGARRDATQSASLEASETISNVPVLLSEHSQDVFVSGLPETVTVKISGPRNLISQITADNFRVEAQGLNDLEPGSHTIRLVAVGLPEKVTGTVTPSRAVVDIDRKETLTLPIEYEVSQNAIAKGYSLQNVQVNPVEVVLTGRSETIQQVHDATIIINPDAPISKNVKQVYSLQIRDEVGQLLDVNADVYEVTATITVEKTNNELPLTVIPQGEQEGYIYQYRLLDGVTMTVDGDSQVINQLGALEVYVDVAEITKTQTVTGYVQEVPGVTLPTSQVEVEVIVTSTNDQSVSLESETSVSESEQEEAELEEETPEEQSKEEENQEESITSHE